MAADDWSPSTFLSALPPSAQAIVLLGAGLGFAYLFWRKYMRQSRDDSAVDQYAVGDPTVFADMGSVKQLVKNVDVLTLQMVKREVTDNELVKAQTQLANQQASLAANAGQIAQKLGEVADLFGAYLADVREQRQEDELDDARREGFAAGQASRPSRATPRRRARKQT